MNQLIACIKKEILENWRKKRFFIYAGIAVLSILLAFATKALLQNLSDELGDMLPLSATNFYASLATELFIIILVIMNMGAVSNEIRQKKLIVPICNGMSTKAIIGAKFIVLGLIAFIFPFFFGTICAMFEYLIYSSEIALSFGDIILTLLMNSVGVMVYVITAVSISALLKMRVWAAVIPLASYFIVSNILLINSGTMTFAACSPFVFTLYYSLNSYTTEYAFTFKPWYYAISISTTILMLSTLIFFSVTRKNVQYLGKSS